jgi:hypothetical protein
MTEHQRQARGYVVARSLRQQLPHYPLWQNKKNVFAATGRPSGRPFFTETQIGVHQTAETKTIIPFHHLAKKLNPVIVRQSLKRNTQNSNARPPAVVKHHSPLSRWQGRLAPASLPETSFVAPRYVSSKWNVITMLPVDIISLSIRPLPTAFTSIRFLIDHEIHERLSSPHFRAR